MGRDELIKKINNFLDQSPLDDGEIKMWREKMLKMNVTDLNELYNLLQEKLKILTESNQLLINIAEDIVEEQNKESAEIPKEINFIDLPITTVAEIIKNDLARYLKDQKTDLVVLLDDYFKVAYGNDEDVVAEFDVLIKALLANNELLDSKSRITIGQWLKLYNQADDGDRRKNINRVIFINQSNEAKKLGKESTGHLLNLFKLCDYLLDPESVLMTLSKEDNNELSRKITGMPKKAEKRVAEEAPRKVVGRNLSEQEKQIIELKQLAAKYSPGSLERKVVEEEIERMTRKS